MKICKDSNEMLQFMADKHLTDKNLIVSVFKTVWKLSKPFTFTTCYGNIEVVLRTIDTLKSIGIMSSVEVTDCDECDLYEGGKGLVLGRKRLV